MRRESVLKNFYMSKSASSKEHWTTRPLLSDKAIDKMNRRAYRAAPYALGVLGGAVGGLAVNAPPYVTKGPKPSSALGMVLGGAAGYGLGKVLQPKGLKKTSSYSKYQSKRLAKGKALVHTNNPNERTVEHRGKMYAYDHKEYTHGTAKGVGIGLGLLGSGIGLVGTRSAAGALGAGAIMGGGGYVMGRSMMNNLGEEGVKGLIDQKADYDLKRIKLRKIG